MSVKLFFALAAWFGWPIWHIDIVGTYLNALLKEEIYIQLPDGHDIPGICGWLLQTIYGLKQSGCEWILLLTAFLLQIGLKHSNVDHSVFYDGHFYILVYVDDFLILTNDAAQVDDFLAKLGMKFRYMNNSIVNHFLGMDVKQTPDGIFIYQRAYICECLTHFSL